MTDKQWVPEVGSNVEFDIYDDGGWREVYLVGRLLDGRWVVQLEENTVDYLAEDTKFRPTQTKVDKYRQQQESKLTDHLFVVHRLCVDEQATQLFHRGIRVIAPDEYVVKALTDEQKGRIETAVNKKGWSAFVPDLWRDIFDEVQREIGIEV